MSPEAKVQVEPPLDLAALPDPRARVTQTVRVTRQLEDRLEGASRRFLRSGPPEPE